MTWVAALALGLSGARVDAASCPFVYVSNEASGDVSVVDPARLREVARIAVGKRPRGLKLSPDGKRLYVALSGTPAGGPHVDESKLPPPDKSADGIGVIDVKARKLEKVLRGVSDPEQLAVTADGARLFVASEDQGVALMLDANDGKVLARTAVGAEPEGTNMAPDGRTVFMTSEAEHRVTALDARTGKAIGSIDVGLRPRSTGFAPDGALAFVTDEAASSLSVISVKERRALRTLPIAGTALPMGVVVSPDGKRVYVSTGRGGQVVALNADSGASLGAVNTGGRPWGLAMNREGTRLFAATGPTNTLAVIDARSMTLLGQAPVGEKPWGATCVPETAAASPVPVVRN